MELRRHLGQRKPLQGHESRRFFEWCMRGRITVERQAHEGVTSHQIMVRGGEGVSPSYWVWEEERE